jgi:hypothetical protein
VALLNVLGDLSYLKSLFITGLATLECGSVQVTIAREVLFPNVGRDMSHCNRCEPDRHLWGRTRGEPYSRGAVELVPEKWICRLHHAHECRGGRGFRNSRSNLLRMYTCDVCSCQVGLRRVT